VTVNEMQCIKQCHYQTFCVIVVNLGEKMVYHTRTSEVDSSHMPLSSEVK